MKKRAVDYIVVGLGNPGGEYKKTRHNIGFMVVDSFARMHTFPDWEASDNVPFFYSKQDISSGKKKHVVELIKPQTFMNKSGKAVLYAVHKHKLKGENIIVVHDDADLPFGSLRVAYNRGSGGHRGVESVSRALKTKAFVRVRVGVIPTTPTGKLKKPRGEQKIQNFLLSEFSKKEQLPLKKVTKRAAEAVTAIVNDGYSQAMNEFN